MVVAYLDTKPNDWNRGPDLPRAKRLKHLYNRRACIETQVARLLACRPFKRTDLVLRRLEKLSALHAEYDRVGTEIITLELL